MKFLQNSQFIYRQFNICDPVISYVLASTTLINDPYLGVQTWYHFSNTWRDLFSWKCLVLRRVQFKLNWAYSCLWSHTIQRKSLSYFKQNLCWIIYITQIMSNEIPQVWILFGGFVVLGWRCHYTTPPGRAAARARAQPLVRGARTMTSW